MAQQGATNADGFESVRHSVEAGVLPVIREEARVEKREVETGRVVVHVVPQTQRKSLDLPLTEEHAEIERVPVGRFVQAPEPARVEGDVTIVPIYEEVVVVERRLMLKEEVRITRRRTVRHEHHELDLRTEDVEVLRSEPPGAHRPEVQARSAEDAGRSAR